MIRWIVSALGYLLLTCAAAAQVGQIPAWPPLQPSTSGPITIPVFSQSGLSSGPSNASASYGAFFGAQNAVYSTNASIVGRSFLAAPITISTLKVVLPTAVVAGTWTVSLYKNNTTAQALTCSINSSGTGVGQVSSTECDDTSHSIGAVATDYVGWKLDPGGTTPTAQASIQISAQAVSVNNGEMVLTAGTNGNVSNAAANYFGVGGASASLNATEANSSSVMPTSGTIDNLYVLPFASPGASGFVFTLYKNGIATGLHCTVNSTSFCSDTVVGDAVPTVVTDTLSIQSCPGTHSGVSGSCTVSGSPTATLFYVGMRWRPTNAGEWPMMATSPAGTPSNTLANYYGLNSSSANSITTESSAQGVAPISFTMKNLILSVATAPGGSGTRNVVLRVNGANAGTPGTMTCPSALTTGTSCQDTTNSYSAIPGQLIDWAATVSGTVNATLGWRVGAVVTVP